MPLANLNADVMQRVVVHAADLPWQASPGPGVWRKRLAHSGAAEAGRVTSIVRYSAGSTFPSHEHPEGEEILVLSGIFSDQMGDYPAGSYLLNPTGSSHAPYADDGCVLFVKLRQYGGRDRLQCHLRTGDMYWQPTAIEGLRQKRLYHQPGYPEQMWLEHWQPGTQGTAHPHPTGEELLVIEGSLTDEHGHYPAGTWLRQPPGSRHQPFSEGGAVVYVCTGFAAGGRHAQDSPH